MLTSRSCGSASCPPWEILNEEPAFVVSFVYLHVASFGLFVWLKRATTTLEAKRLGFDSRPFNRMNVWLHPAADKLSVGGQLGGWGQEAFVSRPKTGRSSAGDLPFVWKLSWWPPIQAFVRAFLRVWRNETKWDVVSNLNLISSKL